MVSLLQHFCLSHKTFAPLFIFALLILAGFSLPISIDLVLVLSAFLAATTLHDQVVLLYLTLLLGTYLSAWIAYWLGRSLGSKLLLIPLFRTLLSQQRLDAMKGFYERHGLLTLIIGRFIPFGVRNCLFLSAGLTGSSFIKFALRDLLASLIWVSAMFTAFFHMSKNLERLLHHFKTFQWSLFLGFSVTVIGGFCYNLKKRKHQKKIHNK